MPYAANQALPDAVRRHHRVAWAAVKKGCRKQGKRWVARWLRRSGL